DGQTLVTATGHEHWGTGGAVQLWDPATIKPLTAPVPHAESVNAVVFSPDGRTFLTGSGELSADRGEAQLWDAASVKPLGPPLPPRGAVWSVAFAPDGGTVISAGLDRTARVWGTNAGDPPGLLRRQPGVAGMSANGDAVLVRAADRSLRLRESATGKPLGPP